MRILMLLLTLVFPLAGFAKGISEETEFVQKVLPTIYRHIELCTHGKKIVVSYDAEGSDMLEFLSERLYGELRRTKNETEMLSRQNVSEKIFSDILSELFADHNKDIVNPDYELWFSLPDYDRIACSLYPLGERDSKTGMVEVFLFKFKPDGVIDFMSRTTIYRDEQ